MGRHCRHFADELAAHVIAIPRPQPQYHVILTHLDLDHAGGLPDFPKARVHVHAREHAVAMAQASMPPNGRYSYAHWRHGPRWAFCAEGGEDWFGFHGVRALGGREPDILMIPLHGHTQGHCGVAVRGDQGWLLHAGDGYFFRGQVATPPQKAPLLMRYFQRKVDVDSVQRAANQERLRLLGTQHKDEVTIFCSHDPVEYDRLATAVTTHDKSGARQNSNEAILRR